MFIQMSPNVFNDSKDDRNFISMLTCYTNPCFFSEKLWFLKTEESYIPLALSFIFRNIS